MLSAMYGFKLILLNFNKLVEQKVYTLANKSMFWKQFSFIWIQNFNYLNKIPSNFDISVHFSFMFSFWFVINLYQFLWYWLKSLINNLNTYILALSATCSFPIQKRKKDNANKLRNKKKNRTKSLLCVFVLEKCS